MAMLNNQMAIQPPKSFGDFLWILETRGATERWCRWLVEKNIVLGDLTGKIGDLAAKLVI